MPSPCSHLPQRARASMLLLALAAAGAQAQTEGGGGGRGLVIRPSFSTSATLTDNLALSSTDKDRALIVGVTPGISIMSTAGRIRGSLDYALTGQLTARTDLPSRFQNQLTARGRAILVEGRIYLDAQASVGQQAISAFGVQSANPAVNRSGNAAEVANLTLTPSISGVLAGMASYDARYALTENRAKGTDLGDGRSDNVSVNLQGLGGIQRLLNWNLSGSSMRNQSTGQRDLRTDSASAGLTWRPDVDLTLSANGGRERTNLITIDQRQSATYGVDASWTPSLRTQLHASWQHHEYGNSHTLSLQHRMSRSYWTFTDSQSVNTGGSQGGGAVPTLYQMFFALWAGLEPDVIKRDELVRNYLRASGLEPNQLATSGFLSNSASTARAQSLAVTLQGLRTSLTLTANRSRSSSLGALGGNSGDFGGSDVVQLKGATISLSHRLTPTSSLAMSLADQRNNGQGLGQSSELKTAQATWTGQLGHRNTFTLGARVSHSNGGLLSYRENAVTGTLSHQF